MLHKEKFESKLDNQGDIGKDNISKSPKVVHQLLENQPKNPNVCPCQGTKVPKDTKCNTRKGPVLPNDQSKKKLI